MTEPSEAAMREELERVAVVELRAENERLQTAHKILTADLSAICAENERLRAALEPFALEAGRYGHLAMDGDYARHSAFLVGQLRRAATARRIGDERL